MNNYTLPTTGGASTTPISQNLGCERWDFLSVFPLLETVLLQLHSWNLRSFLGKREPLCCKGKTNVFASESTVTLLAARAVCIQNGVTAWSGKYVYKAHTTVAGFFLLIRSTLSFFLPFRATCHQESGHGLCSSFVSQKADGCLPEHASTEAGLLYFV